jgi:cytochrome c oxidase subunit II
VPSEAPSQLGGSRPFVTRRRVLRRVAVPVGLVLGALVLGGCKIPTFGAFRGVTVQGHDEFKLWFGMVIAGLVVAIIVWALIFWSIAFYRKKKGDETPPKQFQNHLPLEVIYTTIPIIIVGVIFYFTVLTENEIDATPHPSEIVHVLAFRWGWQFTYANSDNVLQNVVVRTSAEPKLLAQSPKSSQYPQMVLPIGERTEIVLTSNDVVHSFYVPQFNFSRQAIPGITNRFEFTPTRIGVYDGQCNTYCGLYHSEMLFSVRVVTKAAFASWLSHERATQAAQGAAS